MSEPQTPTGKHLAGFLRSVSLSGEKLGSIVIGQVVHDIAVSEAEAIAIGAAQASADFIEAARLNHGERGHPEPWDECRREVCTWVRFILEAGS